MPPSRLVLRGCVVDAEPRTATFPDGRVERLTPREVELLLYLAERPEQVVSRDELLERVWGMDPSALSRVVDTTVRRLREKVEGDPTRPDHVLTTFGEGYRFLPAPAPAPEPPAVPAGLDDEPFVGREEELARVRGWLSSPGPCVLLVGPPGAGKTRLARRIGALLAPSLVGGVLFVDLTEARDLAQVAAAVALALGVESPPSTAATLARVGSVLRGLGPTLLVLDNCEGAPAAAGEVALRLREAAPELRVLATSRELLAHQDPARVLPVQEMALPDAVALFEVYARRVRPEFQAAEQLPVVEALVEKLERIPLALVLAAARVGAFSPRALLDRLDDRFRLLQSRDRDANPRQRTLRAALDGSWELLSPEERDAMTACASFRGGFDLPAAERVVGRPDTAALLAALCQRSLLERRQDRYGSYAFVHEYATGRLAEDPAREEAVFRRHGDCFRDRALASGVSQERGRRMSRDRANLVEAARRAIPAGRVEVAATCAQAAIDVIGREGPFELGVELARAVLALGGLEAADAAMLRLRLAVLEQATGLSDGAESLVTARADAERSGDPTILVEAMRSLAAHLRHRGRSAEAVAELEAALPLAREAGGSSLHHVLSTLANALRDTGRIEEAYAVSLELEERTRGDDGQNIRAHALGGLSILERRMGRFAEAEAHAREAVAHALTVGDRRTETLSRMLLGSLLLDLERFGDARTEYAQALRQARELGEIDTVGRILGNLGVAERRAGNLAAAAEHFRLAEEEFERMGAPRQVALTRSNLGQLAVLRGDDAEGLALLDEAAAWMRTAGDGPSEADALLAAVPARLRLGRTEEARATTDRAEALARAARSPMLLATALARRGLVEVAEGKDARGTLAEIEALDRTFSASSDAGLAVAALRQVMGHR